MLPHTPERPRERCQLLASVLPPLESLPAPVCWLRWGASRLQKLVRARKRELEPRRAITTLQARIALTDLYVAHDHPKAAARRTSRRSRRQLRRLAGLAGATSAAGKAAFPAPWRRSGPHTSVRTACFAGNRLSASLTSTMEPKVWSPDSLLRLPRPLSASLEIQAALRCLANTASHSPAAAAADGGGLSAGRHPVAAARIATQLLMAMMPSCVPAFLPQSLASPLACSQSSARSERWCASGWATPPQSWATHMVHFAWRAYPPHS